MLGRCIALFFLLLPVTATAQKPKDLLEQLRSLPRVSRVYPGYYPYHAIRSIKVTDTTTADSTAYLTLGADTVHMTLDEVTQWDEALAQADVFVQSMGIIGKPYLGWQYGLPGQLRPAEGSYLNLLNGQPTLYLVDPDAQHYYDAYKPYVHVYFAQSSFNTQLLRTTVSQNITPLWNSTVHYGRRTATGNYANLITDHYNLYWNHWLHSRDQRYQLFAGISWQQLTDGLNGGVEPDSTSRPQDLFDGTTEPVLMENTVLEQWLRTAHLHQYYQPFKSKWLGLSVRSGARQYNQRYADSDNWKGQNTLPWRPYGQLLNGDSTVFHTYQYNHYYVQGDMKLNVSRSSYLYHHGPMAEHFSLSGNYKVESLVLNDGLNLDRIVVGGQFKMYNQDSYFADDTAALVKKWKSSWFLHVDGRYVQSNLFEPEYGMKAKLSYQSKQRSYTLLDSTAIDTINYRIARGLRRPQLYEPSYSALKLYLSYENASRNPSLQQAYWQGSTYAAPTGLHNQLVQLWCGSISYTYQQPRIRRGLPYRQSFVLLQPFASRVQQLLYYTPQAELRQADQGVYQVMGARLLWLQRMGRLYLEHDLTWQQNNTTGTELADYSRHLPQLFGRSRFWWEAKYGRSPANFQLGVSAQYRSSYYAQSLEPSLQIGYPQYSTALPGYMQVDAWFTLQVKQTFIFLKLIHANQGLPEAGYYTLPYQPMLHRSFSFGVSWQFFD